ncbi:MAG: hypothetical protein RMJ43_06020 [Chloroherpetonaceae bacterium]|nr:hypothetical protein [Chthonomonadaceae bacterium]MDW8207374.1 hypothetical protein [Chloroherpetonaceae bacterium]
MDLPEAIARACAPLFATLPLEQAMPHLLGSHPVHTALVEEILRDPAIRNRPELIAGLWLYVDDLERSHTVSQKIDTPTGAFWHGIMHRREGDFGNSRYWFRRAAGHPLLVTHPELDPERLVEAVARAHGDDPALLQQQRAEWQALFSWCARNP